MARYSMPFIKCVYELHKVQVNEKERKREGKRREIGWVSRKDGGRHNRYVKGRGRALDERTVKA